MPPPSSTICNVRGLKLGTFLIAFVLLVSEVLPFFSSGASVVEEIWTAEDLSSMAGSTTVSAAVGYLTNVMYRPRLFEREYDDIKTIIDRHTAANIRKSLLVMVTEDTTDKLAKFIRNTNAAATCATAGTAGEHGLDVCLAGCEQKHYFLTWTPRKATCYMLCALATSPCTKDVAGTTTMRTVAWGTMAMSWRELSESWIASVMKWVTMKAPTLMSVINWLVIRVEMAERDISSWWVTRVERRKREIAWRTMQVLFLLKVAYDVYNKIRPVRAHECETENTLKVAPRESDKLKLDQIFETRKKLLNEEGLHALHDLGAWVIDRDSVNGGQR